MTQKCAGLSLRICAAVSFGIANSFPTLSPENSNSAIRLVPGIAWIAVITSLVRRK